MTSKIAVGLFRLGFATFIVGLLVFGASCLVYIALGGAINPAITDALMLSFGIVTIGAAIAAIGWAIEDRQADKRRREMFDWKDNPTRD